MNDYKISIIVPVYNAEKTLVPCLTSLVNQTYENIELILVNDMSTDDSLNILIQAENQYSDKVLVVNLEENLGAGGARNIGLMYASGDYIGFVDSDDIVDVRMYEKLIKCAIDGNYDMVDCGFYIEKEDKALLRTGDNCLGDLDDYKRAELIACGGYLVSRIYKRELWDGITFREHTILEDLETFMLLVLKTKRIGSVHETLYKYCYYENSMSNKTEAYFYHRSVMDAIHAIEDVVLVCLEETYDNEACNEIKKSIEYTISVLCASGGVNILRQDNRLDSNTKKKYLKEIEDAAKRLIHTPIEKNRYAIRGMSKEDRDIVTALMGK